MQTISQERQAIRREYADVLTAFRAAGYKPEVRWDGGCFTITANDGGVRDIAVCVVHDDTVGLPTPRPANVTFDLDVWATTPAHSHLTPMHSAQGEDIAVLLAAVPDYPDPLAKYRKS